MKFSFGLFFLKVLFVGMIIGWGVTHTYYQQKGKRPIIQTMEIPQEYLDEVPQIGIKPFIEKKKRNHELKEKFQG